MVICRHLLVVFFVYSFIVCQASFLDLAELDCPHFSRYIVAVAPHVVPHNFWIILFRVAIFAVVLLRYFRYVRVRSKITPTYVLAGV